MKFGEIRIIDLIIIGLIIFVFIFGIMFNGTKVINVEDKTDFQYSVSKVKPTVVRIYAEATEQKPELMQDYVVLNNTAYSTGTGFFVSNDGKIATAAHVIGDSNSIIVEFQNKQQVKAEILGKNEIADVALIKVPFSDTPFVELANFNTVKEGEDIGFIGYPLDFLIPLLNKATVSAKGNYSMQEGAPQIKLTIMNSFVNRGNSGGPVFRVDTGEVIGVVNSRRQTSELQGQLIQLPDSYSPVMRVGGVDPISLSVETYNRAISLIGNVSQIGIGFSSSSDYILELMEES